MSFATLAHIKQALGGSSPFSAYFVHREHINRGQEQPPQYNARFVMLENIRQGLGFLCRCDASIATRGRIRQALASQALHCVIYVILVLSRQGRV